MKLTHADLAAILALMGAARNIVVRGEITAETNALYAALTETAFTRAKIETLLKAAEVEVTE